MCSRENELSGSSQRYSYGEKSSSDKAMLLLRACPAIFVTRK